MFQVCDFYPMPSDSLAFDEHYSTTHRSFLSRLPGLRHATINWPDSGPDAESAPFHAVTVLYWDDGESAIAALGGTLGPEAAVDPTGLPPTDSFTTFGIADVKVPFTEFTPGTSIRGLLGLYAKPLDENGFRSHYENTHSVLAAKMPRQAAFVVSWTTPGRDGATPPYYLIGNQEWGNQEDLDFCLASPEAAAAIADLDNFVDGDGTTILACRTLIVV
jgi:uncharacterized protein (TIGR02118 family)